MPTASEQYEEARARLEQARLDCKETVKNAFAECAASVFDSHSIIESFSWTQYTPYFNDGDPCEFSANTDYPKLYFVDNDPHKTDEDDDDDDDENEFCKWSIDQKKKNGEELTDRDHAGLAVYELLRKFSQEDYEQMFGDHVRVTVRRGAVDIDEYDHD